VTLPLLPRDYLETAEGLIFAIVDPTPEDGKQLCWLRYARQAGAGRPVKLDTAGAIACLRERFPRYLHHSPRLDAQVHAVPHAAIVRHHSAAARCATLLSEVASDPLEMRLVRLLEHFIARGVPAAELGITGSLLIGAQTASSDFDLVAYSRPVLARLRGLVAAAQASGEIRALDEAAWVEAWARRGCALGFEEYVWHERRKHNKGLFEGTKFDLALVVPHAQADTPTARKLGPTELRAAVTDDTAAYDCPARYRLDHAEVAEIVVFTHTYVGQALLGETVQAAGHLEEDAAGRRRLVIGSSREAPGEYLRVLGPRG
jgi:predicted nucleotidyltransferase